MTLMRRLLVAMLHDIYTFDIALHWFPGSNSVAVTQQMGDKQHNMSIQDKQFTIPVPSGTIYDVSTRLIVRLSRSPTTLTNPSASIALMASLNSPASTRMLL